MFNFKRVAKKVQTNTNPKSGQRKSSSKTAWGTGLLVFGLVTVVSFVYHLPASWVVQQASENGVILQNIKLTEVQGTLWTGQAHIALVEQKQAQSLGQMHWQLSALALLSLHIDSDFSLLTSTGGSRGNVSTGLLNQQQIELSELQGQIPVSDLQPLLPKAYRNLGELKGQLELDNVGLVWDSSSNWLSAINGSLAFSQLDVMGVTFPTLVITPSLQENDIRLETIGGGEGWNLSGQALVNMKQYQADFKIQADKPETMPDWTDLVMRKNSAVLATYKQKGRF